VLIYSVDVETPREAELLKALDRESSSKTS
jgi:hypothetical protein